MYLQAKKADMGFPGGCPFHRLLLCCGFESFAGVVWVLNGGKFRVALAAAAIILIIIAYYGVTILGQIRLPARRVERHVNPSSEATQSPYPGFLGVLVLGAFEGFAQGNVSRAIEQLKSLGFAYIPDRFKFVFDRFTQLMSDEARLLNDTNCILDEAEALIEMGKEGEARLLLDRASWELASVNKTYSTLKAASEELAGTFGLSRSGLFEGLEGIRQFIDKVFQRLLKLSERAEKQRSLEETFLTIDVKPKKVWAGSGINVAGALSSALTTLPKRWVEILVDGKMRAEAITAEDGSFNITLSLPYIHKPSIGVQAKYSPSDMDSEVYKPSVSNIIQVNLLYLKPEISIEPVDKAFPGKTFVLKGTVQAEGPLPYSNVRVLWMGQSLSAALVQGGIFETVLHVPGNVSEGTYNLEVEAPAYEIYAPARANTTVTVMRLPLNVTLEAPSLIFAGVEAMVKGKVLSGETFNLTVTVSFAGQTFAINSSGEFEVKLKQPLTALTGRQTYEVFVEPQLPWYRSLAYKGEVLAINPLTTLIQIGLFSFAAVKLLKGRLEAGLEAEGKASAEAVKVEAAEGLKAKPYHAAKGLEWLIDLYWQAVVIVGALTGVEMKPSMTMREYLKAVAPKLGKLRESFEALTMISEKALYKGIVTDEELKSAREAASNLQVEHVEAGF
jgi:hypothetical protein